MRMNTECFSGARGWIRVIILNIGLASIMMLQNVKSQEYFEDTYKPEGVARMKAMEYGLFGMVITAFFISIILILLLLFDLIKSEEIKMLLDGGLHVLVGSCMFIAAVFFAFSMAKNKTDDTTGTGRIILGILGFFNSILYIIFGLITLFVKKDDDRELPNKEDSFSTISLQPSQVPVKKESQGAIKEKIVV